MIEAPPQFLNLPRSMIETAKGQPYSTSVGIWGGLRNDPPANMVLIVLNHGLASVKLLGDTLSRAAQGTPLNRHATDFVEK